ncbi:hypothetical protein D9613_012965 [Agrocybe pediades]|uniref:Uncharacterized protein n=1 Tax=Agrocybe pediades TaxID=84607 RepID=A0A8H4QUY9_9AGAR|nr:hypothetical protein D9613_012965 [Agrocybe pediades]
MSTCAYPPCQTLVTQLNIVRCNACYLEAYCSYTCAGRDEDRHLEASECDEDKLEETRGFDYDFWVDEWQKDDMQSKLRRYVNKKHLKKSSPLFNEQTAAYLKRARGKHFFVVTLARRKEDYDSDEPEFYGSPLTFMSIKDYPVSSLSDNARQCLQDYFCQQTQGAPPQEAFPLIYRIIAVSEGRVMTLTYYRFFTWNDIHGEEGEVDIPLPPPIKTPPIRTCQLLLTLIYTIAYLILYFGALILGGWVIIGVM